MKKILLVLVAAVFCVATVSAQGKLSSAKWSAGLRATYGIQGVAECFYSSDKYVEGRLGLYGGVSADFTVLHNWNVCTMDWTPSAGKWFFDAGVGVNVGGVAHAATVGAAGCAKLGIKFDAAPVRLAVDITPSIGPIIGYGKGWSGASFYYMGLCNVGISAAYCF